MESLIATKILSTIEYDLATTALTQTTHKIYKIAGSLMTSGYNEIEKTLTILDLEAKLKVLDAILDENSNTTFGKSTDYALANVENIVKIIHNELSKIEYAIKYHKTKYFCYWRSLGCEKNIEKLLIHKKILDERFELFIRTLDLYRKNKKIE